MEQWRQEIAPQAEVCYQRTDGRRVQTTISTDALYGTDGQYLGSLALGTDSTERTQAEAELRHLALHDALTDVPNRTLLVDCVEQAIRAAPRDQHAVALLLRDLDRFKEINATSRHHHGDLLLQQIVTRVQSALRSSGMVARLGGDECAVLLAEDGAGALVAAGTVRVALDAPYFIDGHDYSAHVGTSIGIALYPEHGLDAQMLLRRAAITMRAAKRGGETCAVYGVELDPYTPERLTLIADLRQAITVGQLVLHYQPKVDLASGCTAGVEALVRWAHPQRGLVQPDQFIPLAEETGLMTSLTQWVLEEALGQCQRWRRAGMDLSVAVNVSMTTLHDPEFPDRIALLLQRYGVLPTHLRLEVTESTPMADVERTQEVLNRLAALGVGLSVDDYGTGYSSLAYLKCLPVDELKIDMSFVWQMGTDDADAAIVASTIRLGHSLGVRVVAEGVEDRETRELLTTMGCDAAQGYHWSRPLPAEQVLPWVRDNEATGA